MDEVESEKAVLDSLARARFTVDDRRLSFGIESPLARATIDGRLKALDLYADVSLSGGILKVPLDQFNLFITGLIGEERAKDLERALKKDGHLKDGSLRAHLKRYGSEAARGGANAAGREGMRDLFSCLSGWVPSGGTEAFPGIFGGLG